ncbi:MAG: hypothetical protein ACLSF6_05460 [Evtepia gabavorous]
MADEAHLEGLDAWKCMKNDDFLSQGHSFRRWCIVGHWPVTLYHPTFLRRPAAGGGAAYRLHRRRLLPQGGRPAQRPGAAGKARRGLLLVRLRRPAYRHRPGPPGPVGGLGKHPLGPQRPGGAGAGAELSLCRHLETGRVLEVLTEYLYVDRGVTRCEDSTDYRLAVRPGDTLSVVRRISDRALVKKDGVTGWYLDGWPTRCCHPGRTVAANNRTPLWRADRYEFFS